MSNKIILKKSSVAGRVPVPNDLDYGELALNYSDGRLYYKTSTNGISSLGGSTNFTQIDRQSYTATAGQTTFTIQYGVPYVDVYVNGVHLSDEDYTATTGSSIVLFEACSAGDQVDLVGFSGGIISSAPKTDGDLLIYNGSTQIWENFPQSAVVVGNAAKWSTARTLSFTGDATGSMSVDGSANASAALTLANSGVTSGSYGSASAVPVITVDAQGRITAASTTAVAGVSGVSYNTSTGVIQIDTSNGSSYTIDIGVGTGDSPTFASSVTLNEHKIQSDIVTKSATTADQVLVSLDGAYYRSAEFQIQARDVLSNKCHSVTIKAMHNGTSAIHTEFASMNIGGECATFNVDYSGGNLRLLCTPTSTNPTTFKIASIIGKL